MLKISVRATPRTACAQSYKIAVLLYIYIYIPKTKKFGCVGRGDLTYIYIYIYIYQKPKKLVVWVGET